MSFAEQPCYTLINVPTDAEPPTEVQLKQDLGEKFSFFLFNANIYYLFSINLVNILLQQA